MENIWLITVNGGVHSNTDMEYNSSILNITGICDSVFPAVFHTLQTDLGQGTKAAEITEIPDLSDELENQVIENAQNKNDTK